MGGVAESWTSSDLGRLIRTCRPGSEMWRVVDRIPVSGWDIDHVLIGPGGIFAIESKWSAEGWHRRWSSERIADAVTAARMEARKVEAILRATPSHLRLPVVPVVVLWPAEKLPMFQIVNGTMVISGGGLEKWLSDRPSDVLDEVTVRNAHRAIVGFVRMRETYELERAGAGEVARLWHRIWLNPERA